MEDIDIIQLWKSQDAKIEQALAINQRLLRETINLKAQSAMRSLLRLKAVGIVTFVIYLLFLSSLLAIAIIHYTSAANYFIVSVAAITLINASGFADYIKHAYWASNIDYDGSVTLIQKQLTRLQLSIFRHGRIMCLQFPFFSTFYLSDSWFPQDVSWPYMILQLGGTAALTAVSYWLYRQQRIENLHKKWLRNLMAGSGGKSVTKAMAFYKELGEYE
jgi:hypothetical protein